MLSRISINTVTLDDVHDGARTNAITLSQKLKTMVYSQLLLIVHVEKFPLYTLISPYFVMVHVALIL